MGLATCDVITMFRIESIIQLKEDESVQVVVRRHIVSIVPNLIISMLLIVLPFFFLFPLFRYGVAGIVIFAVSIVAGIALAVRSFILWNVIVMIVTDQRVVDVDQKSIFSRRVTEASYEKIQDVSWKRDGVVQTIFGMGSLQIQTAGTTATLEAENIPSPKKLHELINDLRKEALARGTKSNEEAGMEKDRRSRIRHIAELIEDVGDDELAEVERLLERKSRGKSMEVLFDKPS